MTTAYPWEIEPVLCPCCGSSGLRAFYELPDVPAQSCLVLTDRQDALEFPRTALRLAACEVCGFVCNSRFDRTAVEYSRRYEETQGFSPTFGAFARSLAGRLVERFDLRGKTVMEIGCGKGEFLTLLCELGARRGIGIDPTYVPERNTRPGADKVDVIDDFFDVSHGALEPDVIVCRHTLEHIDDVYTFLTAVREAIGGRDVDVFFEVPDAGRVIGDPAYVDIYNEHCSYFSRRSLTNAFARAGFDVTQTWLEYDDQYLMLTAKPGGQAGAVQPDTSMRHAVETFAPRCRPLIERWRAGIDRSAAEGERVVVWGSGSKCVAFLSTLGVTDEIDYVVDINPHRQGTYMPGVVPRIESPEHVRVAPPDRVIAMNPVYLDEIARQLASLGASPRLTAA